MKVQIIKLFALSQLNYNFNILEVDKQIIRRIETLISEYLWEKKERIKRKTLISKLEYGGISMPDIESIVAATKAAWVTRIFNKENLSFDFINN